MGLGQWPGGAKATLAIPKGEVHSPYLVLGAELVWACQLTGLELISTTVGVTPAWVGCPYVDLL